MFMVKGLWWAGYRHAVQHLEGPRASATRIYKAPRSGLGYQSVQRWSRQDVRHFFSLVPSLLTNSSQHTWRLHVWRQSSKTYAGCAARSQGFGRGQLLQSIPRVAH